MQNDDKDLEIFKSAIADKNMQTKQHQIDGVKWCVKNETIGNLIGNKNIKGGILADEMGLGKTIQMVGLILSNFLLHTLIIVPKAILEQWEKEIFNLTNHHAFIYHGHNKKNKEKLKASPIVITTYGMITNPLSELFDMQWDRAIFDEAHHLKNKNTRVFAGAIQIKSKIKWAVTGTPIQNNKNDFYNICLILGIDVNKSIKQSGFDNFKDIYLKRTKREIGLNLTDVKCKTVNINWGNNSEKKLAEKIHSMTQFTLPKKYQSKKQRQFHKNKIRWAPHPKSHHKHQRVELEASDVTETLPLILQAKQMCIFPSLINKQQQQQHHHLIKGTTYTTKIDSLVETILNRKDNQRPKLIFCHFKGEIDIIKRRLENHFDIQIIDGRTTPKQKKEILANKNEHENKTETETENENKNKILILQIQTGCEGLNLQEYNEVYFVSPHWNPAIESQAIARCHRIGQTRNVEVFRFIMTWDDNQLKSMDEYCEQLQRAKLKVYKEFFNSRSS